MNRIILDSIPAYMALLLEHLDELPPEERQTRQIIIDEPRRMTPPDLAAVAASLKGPRDKGPAGGAETGWRYARRSRR